jgi:ferritin-like protein
VVNEKNGKISYFFFINNVVLVSLISIIIETVLKSLQSQAASTPLYCATSPELKGLSGMYIKDCKPRDESELAKDFQLAFRLHDLVYDVLRDRALLDDGNTVKETYQETTKVPIDETLISNYSG